MSSFHPPESGAQTFTAVSASQSLFGLDDMSPLVDPMLDSPPNGWFTSRPDELYYHTRPPLSPTHEAIGPNFGSAFASHGIPTTVEGMHRPSYPTLNQSMNGVPLHANGVHPQPRLDDLGAISPLQTSYPPYVVADADEDKRKRNQAASARFRQKKKQREQQMLEQSREMVDRTKRLEGEVETLKRENTFLKRLLVEKVDNMNDDDKALLVKTTTADRKA
ncbi:hypothetical protein BDV96DRAFT_164119 [Lophiotrema nucula]|uniref:BZIP domain-containing protein n=1 Tax=Lophiotrema nucula TaxID=690887 RepID=A0A6A5YYM9_9PLEO|nr:hypothetical protein BDV96DRAFT_164119 [Lophiotrema nucula]